jgi:pimeloyl-ACP methyl ester carboxylesterase
MEDFIVASGKEIYYQIIQHEYLEKETPLLIFLHEGLGCSEQWKDFPLKIAKHLHLPALMYDRYGYGRSQQIDSLRSVNYMEEEAREFLPQILQKLNLDHKKLILFGHSDGGSIASFFASFFPEKCIAIIVEAPHFFLDTVSLNGISSAVDAYENGTLKKKLEKFHAQKTESMFRTWTGVLLSPEMRSWDTRCLLENIQCPVLAIQGSEDNFGLPMQIEAIKERAKGNVQLLMIDDCGHMPHHQARELVLSSTIKFIETVV